MTIEEARELFSLVLIGGSMIAAIFNPTLAIYLIFFAYFMKRTGN